MSDGGGGRGEGKWSAALSSPLSHEGDVDAVGSGNGGEGDEAADDGRQMLQGAGCIRGSSSRTSARAACSFTPEIP